VAILIQNINGVKTTKFSIFILLIVILFFLSILSSEAIKAQVMEPDSIVLNQTWEDCNGYNELYIRVYAACNPEKPPYDGHESEIQVKLKNKKYELAVHYELEYDQYQMQMLLFSEENIRCFKIKKAKAVFIPFFYCGNSDSINRVSYIILHNNKSYLKHIDFYCSEDAKCKLLENDLSDIPKSLKKILMQELENDKNKFEQNYWE